jgi:haloalkane dehalogenase
MKQADSDSPHPSFGPKAQSRFAEVLESKMHWVEAGSGDPIVFMHGNPTSSFLWRKIFAQFEGKGRLLAPDMIGFGQSGKPSMDYSLADFQRYYDAWFDMLDLRNVTLVLQDYGGLFGVSWARRHPDRVKAIALLEPVLRPLRSKDLGEDFLKIRSLVLQPGEGEKFVMDENKFVDMCSRWFLKPLPEEERLEYMKPFPTTESRKPVITFPRHLPVDGAPQITVDLLELNAQWLKTSEIPKLLLTFEPGFLIQKEQIDWSRENIKNIEIEAVGPGLHFVQEDQPDGIARAVSSWMERHHLTRKT